MIQALTSYKRLQTTTNAYKHLSYDYRLPLPTSLHCQFYLILSVQDLALVKSKCNLSTELNLEKMNQLRNKVQLIGNLGKDVDYKKLDNGRSLARVSLATKDVYKNQEGEKVVDTQWHTLVGWGKTAENMQVFLKKGKQVAIHGQLRHRSYEDKEGIKRYVSEIWVNEFMMLN